MVLSMMNKKNYDKWHLVNFGLSVVALIATAGNGRFEMSVFFIIIAVISLNSYFGSRNMK